MPVTSMVVHLRFIDAGGPWCRVANMPNMTLYVSERTQKHLEEYSAVSKKWKLDSNTYSQITPNPFAFHTLLHNNLAANCSDRFGDK